MTPTHRHTAPDKEQKSDDLLPISTPPVTQPSAPTSVPDEHEALKSLIEKNIKWSQVIYHQNRKIQRRLSWMVFGSYFRLFLILVPLILGFIFLPPLISDFMKQYGSLIGDTQTWKNYLEIFKSHQ